MSSKNGMQEKVQPRPRLWIKDIHSLLRGIEGHASSHHGHADGECPQVIAGYLVRVRRNYGEIRVAADRQRSGIFLPESGVGRTRGHRAKRLVNVDTLVAIPASF